MNNHEQTSTGAAITLLAFAQLLIALDYNIVFVAIPKIAEGLQFTQSSVQWVVSAYAVVFGGFLLLGGRLADLYGRRRMFVLGMLLYAVASMIGGFANSPWILIGARAGQGLGGAFLAPATLSLVTTMFQEGPTRNRALGIWAAAGSTGMVLGSLLGGVLAGSLGWASVFFVNVPLGLVGAAAAIAFLPIDEQEARRISLDIPGAVTSTAGTLLVVYGMVQASMWGWRSPIVGVPLAFGVALLTLFLLIESKTPVPLVPLALFRDDALRKGTVTTFLFMASFGAIPYFVTIYLQDVAGVSAVMTGLIFVLPSACVLVGTMIGGRLMNVWSASRSLVLAWAVGAAGTAVLAMVMSSRSALAFGAIPFAILSVFQGIVFTIMFAVATSTVSTENQGIGSGIATSGQQVGGAMGLAALVTIASGIGSNGDQSNVAEFTVAGTWAIAALMLIGVLVSVFIRIPSSQAVDHSVKGGATAR